MVDQVHMVDQVDTEDQVDMEDQADTGDQADQATTDFMLDALVNHMDPQRLESSSTVDLTNMMVHSL